MSILCSHYWFCLLSLLAFIFFKYFGVLSWRLILSGLFAFVFFPLHLSLHLRSPFSSYWFSSCLHRGPYSPVLDHASLNSDSSLTISPPQSIRLIQFLFLKVYLSYPAPRKPYLHIEAISRPGDLFSGSFGEKYNFISAPGFTHSSLASSPSPGGSFSPYYLTGPGLTVATFCLHTESPCRTIVSTQLIPASLFSPQRHLVYKPRCGSFRLF